MRSLLSLLLLAPLSVVAQTNLVISGFSPNGLLTWSNVVPNSTCGVEWASSPAGPWTSTWEHLNEIPTGTNSQLSAYVPMFYRVVMTALPSAPTYTIDWCRLQWPLSLAVATDEEFTIYGQVYIASLTDQSTSNDPAENVVADVGYGPDGTDPSSDLNWTWVRGAPNPGYVQPVSSEFNDEYMATLSVPQAGTYDFAVRFSGDGGTTWSYGDSNGTADGYQVANAGDLSVTNVSFRIVGAEAPSSWELIVYFNAEVDPSRVNYSGSPFLISSLSASGAEAVGSQVNLLTSSQTPGQEYTLQVSVSVRDMAGRQLDSNYRTATFSGYQ